MSGRPRVGAAMAMAVGIGSAQGFRDGALERIQVRAAETRRDSAIQDEQRAQRRREAAERELDRAQRAAEQAGRFDRYA